MTGAPAAKLVLGVLFGTRTPWERARRFLEERFGPLDPETLTVPFDHTGYYEAEMGPGLTRLFCSFREPLPQDELAAAKKWTVRLEGEQLAGEGRGRTVNLDPGLLCVERLVLASTKDFSHRVYLRDGIFAEVELVCREGAFHPLPWTYPDYRRRETLDFFDALRVHWRRRLRREREGA